MVELLKNQEEFVAFLLSGWLAKFDYSFISPLLDEKISTYGKIKVYWEMKDFKGWTPYGLWEDLKFDMKHRGHISKIAMVGETQWQAWLTELMKPFTPAKVKFFPSESREEALLWAQE